MTWRFWRKPPQLEIFGERRSPDSLERRAIERRQRELDQRLQAIAIELGVMGHLNREAWRREHP